LIPSSELLASKPRDCTLKREQNSCYKHDNGLTPACAVADHNAIRARRRIGETAASTLCIAALLTNKVSNERIAVLRVGIKTSRNH
jgi:hypothetical protein